MNCLVSVHIIGNRYLENVQKQPRKRFSSCVTFVAVALTRLDQNGSDKKDSDIKTFNVYVVVNTQIHINEEIVKGNRTDGS